MKKLLFYTLILMLTAGCGKTISTELVNPPIQFTTDASAVNISTAKSFPVRVTINSTMPSRGITYSVLVTEEANGQIVNPQMGSFSSTNAQNRLTLTSLPQQKWCIANITAEETGNSSNKATTSFRVIYK